MKNITFHPNTSSDFSKKALNVLALCAEGYKGREIAEKLYRSEPTIRSHQLAILEHYSARNTTHAVAIAIAVGDIQFRIQHVTNNTHSRRATALAFALLALFVGLLDTPFVSDVDQDLIRQTTRISRQHKVRGRRESFESLLG